jgi:hypothetical protein
MTEEKINYVICIDGIEFSEPCDNILTARDVADDFERKGYQNVEIYCYEERV